LFRNRLFPEFPGWFGNLLIGDWALHILNAAHGDIGFMPEIMSAYRVHRGGIWSGATTAERLVGIFDVFSAVDHHFEGKYTQAINSYRAATIRHLVSQVDAVASHVSDVADQLGSAHAQREVEAVRLIRLEALLESVHNERQRLAEDNSRLQAFYDTWTQSILYRVEREIRRPFLRLHKYMRNRRQGEGGQSPPSEPSISKAA
jgi:hypothetical protein